MKYNLHFIIQKKFGGLDIKSNLFIFSFCSIKLLKFLENIFNIIKWTRVHCTIEYIFDCRSYVRSEKAISLIHFLHSSRTFTWKKIRFQCRKMKIFKKIRGHLKMLGIERTQSTRIYSINGKLSIVFLSFALSIILSTLFVVYSAKVTMDYILCFCIISALIAMCFCFVAITLQKIRLFNYIECIEKLIKKSKFFSNNLNGIW